MTAFILSTLFLITSFGCKKLNIEKELRIDLGTSFQNDFVTIALDNNVVFADSVTTNPILGVAKVVVLNQPIGNYTISVKVNGVEKADKFKHKKDRYIYVSFDKANADITISYPKEKSIYD